MPSPETPTLQEHQQIQRKYVSLAWQLWQEQYKTHFFVWHPIPEEHLRIEVVLFWRGEITQVHGWTNILGQILAPIRDAINAIVSWFWTNVIQPGISGLLYVLRCAMDLAFSAVRSILWWIWNVLKYTIDLGFSVVSSTLWWIWNVLAGLGAWIQNAIAGVTAAIQGVLSTLWQGIQGIGNAISSGLSWLAGELTKATAWIWNQLEGFFSSLGEVLKQIGVWIVNAIKTYVVDPILAGLGVIFDAIKGLITSIWNFITGGIMAHSPQEWRGSYVRWLGIITGVSVLAVSGFIGAAIADVIHPLKDTRLKEVAEFALRFSGMGFLQAAFFTTFFDIATAKPVRQELNSIFTPEVPGSGDLIRFVVREVLPPEDFYVAMGMHGFSRYWAVAYWDAHWVLPPPERTRTAFLRKQISEEEYRKFLIWYDFKPEFRPGISKSDVDIMLLTQYEWPGRIDMRWLLEWGEISPEELNELLKSDGVDPTWAPRIGKVWLLNQLREELGKVRGVYERRLRAGFMKREAFAAALKGINYADHVIKALETWAEEELALDEVLDLSKEFEALAKAEAITIDQYGQALRDLGMIEERITRAQKHIEMFLAMKAMKAAAKPAPGT